MSAERATGSWVTQVKFVCLLLVVVLVLIVIFQNNESIEYEVLFWTPSLPRYLLPLVAFLVGMLSGIFVPPLLRRRR
ncbi:MAG: LapA family protein [Candidatus Brocadiia bacterium]